MTNDRLNELGGRLEELMGIEGGERGALQSRGDLVSRYNALAGEGAASEELRTQVNENQAYLLLVKAAREKVSKYLVREMEGGLVGELDDKKLAKNVYSVRPSVIEGDEAHNERANIHAHALKAEEVVRTEDSDIEELARYALDGLMVEANAEIEKKYSKDNNPDISDETRNALIGVLPSLSARVKLAHIKGDRESLRGYANMAVREYKKGFEKSFKTDKDRAAYVKANLEGSYKQIKGQENDEMKQRGMAELAKDINRVYKTKVD